MSSIIYKHAYLFLLMAAMAVGSFAADTLPDLSSPSPLSRGARGVPVHCENYSYHEGFENAFPDVKLWAKNGECVVNYLGPSEEKAFEGKKSLKLDVTITGGSYHYFGLTMKVPCEGKLRMSAPRQALSPDRHATNISLFTRRSKMYTS
jgi:hypothetical protein